MLYYVYIYIYCDCHYCLRSINYKCAIFNNEKLYFKMYDVHTITKILIIKYIYY